MRPATALEVATMPTRGYHHVSSVIRENEGVHTSDLVQNIASYRIRAFRFFQTTLTR